MSAESITGRARQGTVWTLLEQTYVWTLNFGAQIVLARLLMPRDFGLIAMVLLVQQLVLLFGAHGIAASLVQRRDDVDEYANAAFWLTPLVGAGVGLLQLALAQVAARVYHEPQLASLLSVSAIGFFVSPWGATHATLLLKSLQIKRRALRHMILRTVVFAGTVVMALRGYGVWSFVIPHLLADPIEVYLNWRLCPWRPRWPPSMQHWRAIGGYGKHVMANDVARYLIHNTDYLILGRVLGAGALGMYAFAFRQAMFASEHVTRVAARMTFPTFAHLQTERAHLQRAFTKTILLVSSLTLPLQVGQLILAREYIAVVYSPKWLPAVEAFRILLLYGVTAAVATLPRQLLSAMGRPDLVWKFQAVVWPVLVAGIVAGVRGGVTGAALAVALILGTSSWLMVRYALRILGWSAAEVLAPARAPLLAAAVMAAAITGLREALVALHAGPVVVLAACVPAAVLVYAAALAGLFPAEWRQLFGFAGRAVQDFGRDASGLARRTRRKLSVGATT